MAAPILVTWATRYGSTEEVAHAVAGDLMNQHFAVNAQPMNDVRSLDRYCAVVLGFALYMGRIHKDARRFLANFRDELVKRPVAVFVLGPVNSDPHEFKEAEKQLKKELAPFPWLTPVTLQVMGGRFDPTKLGMPFNFIPALRNMPPLDARDWDSIHAWASHLSGTFPTTAR